MFVDVPVYRSAMLASLRFGIVLPFTFGAVACLAACDAPPANAPAGKVKPPRVDRTEVTMTVSSPDAGEAPPANAPKP